MCMCVGFVQIHLTLEGWLGVTCIFLLVHYWLLAICSVEAHLQLFIGISLGQSVIEFPNWSNCLIFYTIEGVFLFLDYVQAINWYVAYTFAQLKLHHFSCHLCAVQTNWLVGVSHTAKIKSPSPETPTVIFKFHFVTKTNTVLWEMMSERQTIQNRHSSQFNIHYSFFRKEKKNVGERLAGLVHCWQQGLSVLQTLLSWIASLKSLHML